MCLCVCLSKKTVRLLWTVWRWRRGVRVGLLWSYDLSETTAVLWPASQSKTSVYLERKQHNTDVNNITVNLLSWVSDSAFILSLKIISEHYKNSSGRRGLTGRLPNIMWLTEWKKTSDFWSYFVIEVNSFLSGAKQYLFYEWGPLQAHSLKIPADILPDVIWL